MEPIVDFLISLGGWNWFVLALLLFLLEVAIPGVFFLWFGVAATVIGMVALSIDVPWQFQLIGFAGISVISVVVGRQTSLIGKSETDKLHLNVRGAQYIGRIVTVETAIVNGRGRVRVGDTLWWAEGPDFDVGAQVKVTGINGTALVVAPVAAAQAV